MSGAGAPPAGDDGREALRPLLDRVMGVLEGEDTDDALSVLAWSLVNVIAQCSDSQADAVEKWARLSAELEDYGHEAARAWALLCGPGGGRA